MWQCLIIFNIFISRHSLFSMLFLLLWKRWENAYLVLEWRGSKWNWNCVKLMVVSELCLIIIKSDISLAVSIVRNNIISSQSLIKSTLLQYIVIPLPKLPKIPNTKNYQNTKNSFRVFVPNIFTYNEPLCKAFGFLLCRNNVQIPLTKSSLSAYYAYFNFRTLFHATQSPK